jgi:pimeloyl-ACP methyl ester carboxylesterase
VFSKSTLGQTVVYPVMLVGEPTRTRAMRRLAAGAAILLAIVVVVSLVAAGFLGTGIVWTKTSSPVIKGPIPPTNYSIVYFESSVDGFSLSYSEWLPSDFSPARSYPLVVYLHGQQDTSGRWFSGGLTSDLVQSLTNATDVADRETANALINATRSHDAILIALNSRSGSGWYINSPCGGPQEQDVLDAIAFERALRPVSHVYLMGESMGTEGTLFVASQNPGLFAGVAIVAPVTDLFQDVYYRMTLASNPQDPWASISIQAKAHLFCGVLPGTENSSQEAVARMFQNMSPLRFNPAAFLNVPIYVTAGGLDNRAPNNVTIWSQWMNANNTFVNATCNFVPQLGEPPPPFCSTQTFEVLHRANPSGYAFRYVYEPQSGHAVSQLPPDDLLGFWLGALPGGYYLGTAGSEVVVPAPGLTY